MNILRGIQDGRLDIERFGDRIGLYHKISLVKLALGIPLVGAALYVGLRLYYLGFWTFAVFFVLMAFGGKWLFEGWPGFRSGPLGNLVKTQPWRIVWVYIETVEYEGPLKSVNWLRNRTVSLKLADDQGRLYELPLSEKLDETMVLQTMASLFHAAHIGFEGLYAMTLYKENPGEFVKKMKEVAAMHERKFR